MGIGDEIMALGRAETVFEKTGKPCAITRPMGYARVHDAWRGNPAWDSRWSDGRVVPPSVQQIVDGAAQRPYIKQWNGRCIEYNMAYRPRAGKIFLTEYEKDFASSMGRFYVVSPFVKENASPNKEWSKENWESVIKGLPFPVYQLAPDNSHRPIKGAQLLVTKTFRYAAAVIERAEFVMCNEGGTHHMAASMRRPAVVIFGSYVPPCVTGYDTHINISVETKHGFCGNFDRCNECEEAMAQITPDVVRSGVAQLLARALHG